MTFADEGGATIWIEPASGMHRDDWLWNWQQSLFLSASSTLVSRKVGRMPIPERGAASM